MMGRVKLLDAAGALLTQVAAAYPADEVRKVIQAGALSSADWCSGGCATAYVRLDSYYPTVQFPTQALNASSCEAKRAARFHVGIARCVTGMDSAGNPPSPEDQSADALMILDDALTLAGALTCALRDDFPRRDAVLGAWTPVGVQGNCAGGYWPITVKL